MRCAARIVGVAKDDHPAVGEAVQAVGHGHQIRAQHTADIGAVDGKQNILRHDHAQLVAFIHDLDAAIGDVGLKIGGLRIQFRPQRIAGGSTQHTAHDGGIALGVGILATQNTKKRTCGRPECRALALTLVGAVGGFYKLYRTLMDLDKKRKGDNAP